MQRPLTNELMIIGFKILWQNKRHLWWRILFSWLLMVLVGVVFTTLFFLVLISATGINLLSNLLAVALSYPVIFFASCLVFWIVFLNWAIIVLSISGVIDQAPLSFGKVIKAMLARMFPLFLLSVLLGLFVSWIFYGLLHKSAFTGLLYVIFYLVMILLIWAVPFICLAKKGFLAAIAGSIGLLKKTIVPQYMSYLWLFALMLAPVILTLGVFVWYGLTPIMVLHAPHTQPHGFMVAISLIKYPNIVCTILFLILQSVMYRYFTDPVEPNS